MKTVPYVEVPQDHPSGSGLAHLPDVPACAGEVVGRPEEYRAYHNHDRKPDLVREVSRLTRQDGRGSPQRFECCLCGMAEAEHEREESHEGHPEPQLLPERRESDAEEEEKRVPRDRARLDSGASLDYLEKAYPEGKGSECDYGSDERIGEEFTRSLSQR